MPQTRIAFLRGSNLNEPELVSYVPLLKEFAFSFYRSARSPLPIRLADIQTETLWYGEDLIRLLPPGFRRLAFIAAKRLFSGLDMPFNLSRICRTHHIVHTAESSTYYTREAIKLKQKYAHKVVVTVWENNPFQYENEPTNQQNLKLGHGKSLVRQQADHFLVPAQLSALALQLEGVQAEKITWTGAAVDLERFKPRPKRGNLQKQLNLDSDASLILFAGRLIWEKGVFDLLEAFSLLHRTGDLAPHVHLLYFGSGREKAGLECERAQLGLQSRVHFLTGQAYANSDQMPGVYNDVDLLVLPSLPSRYWQEQFGMVLIEAMASGVPVIGSTSGAIPEVVGDAGAIFSAHDIRALATEIKRMLLPEQHEQASIRGRSRVAKIYSPEAVSARIQQAYLQVLDSH